MMSFSLRAASSRFCTYLREPLIFSSMEVALASMSPVATEAAGSSPASWATAATPAASGSSTMRKAASVLSPVFFISRSSVAGRIPGFKRVTNLTY